MDSLQHRLGLVRKPSLAVQAFDNMDDCSVSDSVDDLNLKGLSSHSQAYASSLGPAAADGAKDDPLEEKEQAPAPEPPSNEAAAAAPSASSVLGRLLAKHIPSSPRKSSKNSFSSFQTSKMPKLSSPMKKSSASMTGTEHTSSAPSNTSTAGAEEVPQTPSKPNRRGPLLSQFRPTLLQDADSASVDTTSDDDDDAGGGGSTYLPSSIKGIATMGMALSRLGRPKMIPILSQSSGLSIDDDTVDDEGDKEGERDQSSEPSPPGASSQAELDVSAKLDRDEGEDEKKEGRNGRPKLLPCPSGENFFSFADLVAAKKSVPSTSEAHDSKDNKDEKEITVNVSARPQRRGVRQPRRRGGRRPGAQPMPSRVTDPDADADCEIEIESDSDSDSAGENTGGYLPASMASPKKSPKKSCRPTFLSAPSEQSLDCAFFEQDDKSSEPKPLAAPSQIDLCFSFSDLVIPSPPEANGNKGEKDSTVKVSAKPKRRAGRRPTKPQQGGAQFMPSLISDPDADCENKDASGENDVEYLPSLDADADYESGDSSDEDDVEYLPKPDVEYEREGSSDKVDCGYLPKPDADYERGGSSDEVDRGSLPKPDADYGYESESSEEVDLGYLPKPNADADFDSDPDYGYESEREEEAPEEVDRGYQPISMGSKAPRMSRRPSLLAFLEVSNEKMAGDHNEDDHSDLRPDANKSGVESGNKDESESGPKSQDDKSDPSSTEPNEPMSKLDNSLEKLALAFEDQDDGSQVNLYLAKVRESKEKDSGGVDLKGGSVRSTRSSLSFSVTVDPNGETKSINVDTRLPTIESPTKKKRSHRIRGETNIPDLSNIDAPSFAVKSERSRSSAEDVPRHSQRSSRLGSPKKQSSPKKQPRESPQTDPSERSSRSVPKNPKTPRSKTKHRSRTSQPDEDIAGQPADRTLEMLDLAAPPVTKTGRSGEKSSKSLSKSMHNHPRSPRKTMRVKGEVRVHPSPLLASPLVGGDEVGQPEQSPENKVSSRVDMLRQEVAGEDLANHTPESRRQFLQVSVKEDDNAEDDASPTSVAELASPKKQERGRAGSISSTSTPVTPRSTSSRDLFKSTTPNSRSGVKHLSSPVTPRSESSGGLFKATTPRSMSRSMSSRDFAQKDMMKKSDSFRNVLQSREMGESDGIKNICSLKDGPEASSGDLNQESLQKSNSPRNLSNSPRNLSNSPRNLSNSPRNLNQSSESPGKTSNSRNVYADSKRKTSSMMDLHSPRKTSNSRHLNSEPLQRTSSLVGVPQDCSLVNDPQDAPRKTGRGLGSPRKTMSSRHLNSTTLHTTSSSMNVPQVSPRKTGRASPRKTMSSRHLNSKTLQKTSSSHTSRIVHDGIQTVATQLQQMPSIDV
jgi:hypothetical protein